MTVKAGQKCTAIRRIFVAAAKADAVAEALAAKLKSHQGRRSARGRHPHGAAGDARPAGRGVRGHSTVGGRSRRSCAAAPSAPALDGIDRGRSAFVAPTLLKLKDRRGRERGARGRGLRPRRNGRALSRRAGGRRAGRARRRLAGRFGLRRGSGVPRPHGRRDRAEPRTAAHGRPVDRERPYRPRHRHAAMQSRRSRPRRRQARSWAVSTACASITSAWRCRARAICSRSCRRRRQTCTEAGA